MGKRNFNPLYVSCTLGKVGDYAPEIEAVCKSVKRKKNDDGTWWVVEKWDLPKKKGRLVKTYFRVKDDNPCQLFQNRKGHYGSIVFIPNKESVNGKS